MKNYTCAICGTEYETIEERAACESACIADKQRREELLQLKKESEAREASEQSALDAIDVAEEAVKKHFQKYKYLTLNKNHPYLKLLFKNKTWWL